MQCLFTATAWRTCHFLFKVLVVFSAATFLQTVFSIPCRSWVREVRCSVLLSNQRPTATALHLNAVLFVFFLKIRLLVCCRGAPGMIQVTKRSTYIFNNKLDERSLKHRRWRDVNVLASREEFRICTVWQTLKVIRLKVIVYINQI